MLNKEGLVVPLYEVVPVIAFVPVMVPILEPARTIVSSVASPVLVKSRVNEDVE